MAKKTKSKGVHQELHPMLLKGILIGLLLGLGWMVYVNLLSNKYETTVEGSMMEEKMMKGY